MSDHPVEEPEKDRTFTAVVVIGVALTLALGVWKDGRAAPDTSPNPKLMSERLGSVQVRFKGSEKVYNCVILERGSARHLLLANGQEFVIPRGEEIEILDAKGAPVAKEAKQASRPKKRPTAKRGQGMVINHEGDAFKGMLTVTAERIVVSTGKGETISVPMADVRWHKFGVNAPDQAYWKAFPELPVKGYAAPGEGNELRSKAEIAFAGGDWPEATRAYLTLFVAGENAEANLRRAAYNWTGTGTAKGPSRDRAQALNALEVLFRPHRSAHPALNRILARTLQDMAQDCLRSGLRKDAVDYAKRLRALGDDFAPAAQKILDQAR